mmetsp:Transcript_8641/g.23449  ORF Transcript_8641/g.23449 Transcript_8641/m.23449 type:complete len:207 (+) Transcript_8641:380-1000(+)
MPGGRALARRQTRGAAARQPRRPGRAAGRGGGQPRGARPQDRGAGARGAGALRGFGPRGRRCGEGRQGLLRAAREQAAHQGLQGIQGARRRRDTRFGECRQQLQAQEAGRWRGQARQVEGIGGRVKGIRTHRHCGGRTPPHRRPAYNLASRCTPSAMAGVGPLVSLKCALSRASSHAYLCNSRRRVNEYEYGLIELYVLWSVFQIC